MHVLEVLEFAARGYWKQLGKLFLSCYWKNLNESDKWTVSGRENQKFNLCEGGTWESIDEED